MKIYRGDVIFTNGARPGVVTDNNPKTGKLLVETEGPVFEKARKYGFINGLKPEERNKFQNILDEMRAVDDPSERIQRLTQQIAELEQDPRNLQLVRYLTAEKAHLMYSTGVNPKNYSIDETLI